VDGLRARLRTELGYPKQATEADRAGGGHHVPLHLCATTEAVEVDAAGEAIIPPEFEARLRGEERAVLRVAENAEPTAFKAPADSKEPPFGWPPGRGPRP
jgi:hypothetical protein